MENFDSFCTRINIVAYEAGFAKNFLRGGSGGARSESRARGTGAVYCASEGSCETVVNCGDGAFVAAAPLCAHLRTFRLNRYQTLVSEITFISFVEVRNHQNSHTKVSSCHHKAPQAQPQRPKTKRARFESVRHGSKYMTMHGAISAGKRKSYDDAMLMRAHHLRHGAPKWRAQRDRRTRDCRKRFSMGF
jgi:hypothetical protein